jgi:hypothetical protein
MQNVHRSGRKSLLVRRELHTIEVTVEGLKLQVGASGSPEEARLIDRLDPFSASISASESTPFRGDARSVAGNHHHILRSEPWTRRWYLIRRVQYFVTVPGHQGGATIRRTAIPLADNFVPVGPQKDAAEGLIGIRLALLHTDF